jgi:hypothetical protein
MPADAASWYDPVPDRSGHYQGDVVDDIPILHPPPADKGWYLLRPSTPTTLSEARAGKVPKAFLPRAEKSLTDAWQSGPEFPLISAHRGRVMLLTQTCDIDNRTVVQVAPVLEASLLAGKLESLRKNDINYLFHLPSDPPAIEKESMVDLSQIAWVQKGHLRQGRFVRRLTRQATVTLQGKLARMHGRLFAFSPADQVPQDGEYVCFGCFIKKLIVTSKRFATGSRFTSCDVCGVDDLWLKPDR